MSRSLTNRFEDDQWLGSLYSFPTVLHARASLSFDINPQSLQRSLLSVLSSLHRTSIVKDITVADRRGYSVGTMQFKVGIGDGEGFDILDKKVEARALDRIENRGPFDTLDFAFQLHYEIDDGLRHKVHMDHYAIRLVFRPGRVEVLVHHVKGIRRVEPVELVRLILERLNAHFVRDEFPELSLEVADST